MPYKKVVICDDDRTMLHILKHLLEKQGFETYTASNGDEGLSLITDHQPDFLMLDVNMPGKSGIQILEILNLPKSKRPAPYVMMVSNHEKPEIMEKAISLGAHDYVYKPFNPLALLNRIKELQSAGKI